MSSYYYNSNAGGAYPIYTQQPALAQQQKMPAAYEGAKSSSSWSWKSTGCSLFSVLCCWCCFLSPVFGLCGLVFSLTSYSDHKSGDAKGSKSKKKWAWGCTILAIVMGLLMIAGIALCGYFFVDPISDFLDTLWDLIPDDDSEIPATDTTPDMMTTESAAETTDGLVSTTTAFVP